MLLLMMMMIKNSLVFWLELTLGPFLLRQKVQKFTACFLKLMLSYDKQVLYKQFLSKLYKKQYTK